MSKTIRQTLRDAATWLRKNPDRHIAVSLATTKGGRECHPLDKRAQCFCALGRIVAESGIRVKGDTVGWESLDQIASALEINTSSIYELNDYDPGIERPLICPTERPGNPAVIDLLRRLANRARAEISLKGA